MKLEVWGKSDTGQKRDSNQDSMLIDEKYGLFIVADGMGGHKGGEVASALAIEEMQKFIRNAVDSNEVTSPRELISKAYQAASGVIYNKSLEENGKLKGMGTTMVMAFHYKDELYIGNVGDSRAYLFLPPYLWQLTEDHSLINEQIRAGFLKEDQRSTVVGRNVITRSVGYEPVVECDIIVRDLHPGERFLICSDGLTGLVGDERIADIMMIMDCSEVAERCVDEANWNGGDDNVTTLVIRVT